MNCLVILNPKAAGGRAAKLAPLLRTSLSKLRPSAQLHVSQSIADARAAIDALAHESRVVLIGGDGTLHQMLPSLLQGRHELGLVPYGSGNDTARALGLLKMDVVQALAHALQGTAGAIDIGFAELDTHTPIPFISSLAAGFDAAIALRAHQSPKWLIGLPRYLYATLLEIKALKRTQVALTVDGMKMNAAPLLFSSVLNTPTYGSGMPAVPQARINDGALDVLIAGEFNRMGALLMLPRLLAGKHLTHPHVKALPFQTLIIESQAALPLAADGEPLPASRHIQVRVSKTALKVARK